MPMKDEYMKLMYFYKDFFKEIMGEAMDLMGRRGILAILRTASRKYASERIKGVLKEYSSSEVPMTFKFLIETLFSLARPEINDFNGTIILKRCPFKTRPTSEQVSLDEDVFCSVCVGFINGICAHFQKRAKRLVESRVRRSRICKFEE